MNHSYERVRFGRAQMVYLRDVKESVLAISGVEVNRYGDEVIPKGRNTEGQQYTDRLRFISKHLINGRQEMQMSKKCAELEVV